MVLLLLLSGCGNIDLRGGAAPEIQGCQTCHLSPPPTGEHPFHLMTQTHRSQITCDECHESAISEIHWETKVNRQFQEFLYGFHSLTEIDSQTIELIAPWTFIKKRSACNTRVEDNKIYIARTDSIKKPGILGITWKDSLETTDNGFKVFLFDTTFLDKDSSRVTKFKSPQEFDNCRFLKKGDSVYSRVIDDIDSLYLTLTTENRFTRSSDGSMFYFYHTYNRHIDTSIYIIRQPEDTFLKGLPESQRSHYTTKFKDRRPGVLANAKGELFQIKNDTLYNLIRDSVIFFDDDFAEMTGLHADGKIDIQFKHEEYTYYRQQILEENRNPITGEIESVNLGSIGSWRPREKSCWKGGIANAHCHNELEETTYWYPRLERGAD